MLKSSHILPAARLVLFVVVALAFASLVILYAAYGLHRLGIGSPVPTPTQAQLQSGDITLPTSRPSPPTAPSSTTPTLADIARDAMNDLSQAQR